MSMVEWKKLGEVCTVITPPIRIGTGDYCSEGIYPIIDQGQNVIVGYTDNEDAVLKEDEYVLFGDHTRYVKFYKGKFAQGADGLKILRAKDAIVSKYLYYVFSNIDIPSRGYNRHWIIAKEFQIPIPSLSEQSRIVGILDTFTASIANLKEQIGERRKQYYYLIDNMFGGSYEKMLELGDRGELLLEPLSSHGVFTRGRRFVRTDVVENGMPCIHYGDMYTYYGIMAKVANTFLPYDFPKKMRYAKKGDVVIVGAGENNEDIGVGVAWLGDEPAAVHDACYIYESDFDAVFLSYYLRSSIYHHQIKSNVVRGKICSISSDGIGRALIPIYSIEKQKKIVESLLPFEASIANLEAQFQEREKQYEHYRNQLLTFE